jgi:hypothetical protein
MLNSDGDDRNGDAVLVVIMMLEIGRGDVIWA